jgi:hypothetical protein
MEQDSTKLDSSCSGQLSIFRTREKKGRKTDFPLRKRRERKNIIFFVSPRLACFSRLIHFPRISDTKYEKHLSSFVKEKIPSLCDKNERKQSGKICFSFFSCMCSVRALHVRQQFPSLFSFPFSRHCYRDICSVGG